MVLAAVLLATASLAAAAEDREGESALPPLQAGEGAGPAASSEGPPPGAAFVPWRDWSTGQKVRPLPRINLDFAAGAFQPGLGLPGMQEMGSGLLYEDAFYNGPAARMEAGYAFAPSLSVSLGYFGGLMEGNDVQAKIGGKDYYLYFRTLSYNAIYVGGRFQIPLALIGPDLFRFSRARQPRGVVFSLKLALGGVSLGALSMEREDLAASTWETVRIFENTKNVYVAFGMQLDFRWGWGSGGLEVEWQRFGKPSATVEAPGSREALSGAFIGLAFSLHF